VRDRIILEGLRIDAWIGVYAHEHGVRQRLDVDVIVETSIAEAARTDDVAHTVDYDRIAQIASDLALSEHHQLIETLADGIADRVLATFVDRVASVTVRVKKPGAVRAAANVMVEATRSRASRDPAGGASRDPAGGTSRDPAGGASRDPAGGADGPRARTLVMGAHRLALGRRALVMGVVNATPDSFYDRGKFFDARDPGPAIARAEALIAEGADLVDIGGETAQPSSPVLSTEDEIARVVPVIRALASRVTVPISVDTYKLEVARAAIDAGASLINDTSGLADPRLGALAASSGAGIVLMHITGHPKQRLTPGYADPVGAITGWMADQAAFLRAAGVPRERILLDPGIGFGKTPAESLRLTAGIPSMRALGYAVLYACSRRTFLGDLMGGLPPEDRLEPTVAVNTVAIRGGADMVRVHDVRFFARLTKMLAMISG